MTIFTGCATALVTPFTDKGEVNCAKYEQLIDFQLDNGVEALVVCGSTGESATVTDEEKLELLSVAVARAGRRCKVIAGTGSNDTEHAARLTRAAAARGADAVLVVTPYYNKTTPAGLKAHYGRIAGAADVPVIVYNVPTRTGLNIPAAVVKELSGIPGVSGIKEASGNIVQVLEIKELCGDAFDIYAGNDDYVIPVLASGGVGVISTMSNIIPRDTRDMVAMYLSGEREAALRLQLKAMGLVRALFCEVNPIPVKEALNLMGMAVGGYRLPLVGMSERGRELLQAEMRGYGLLQGAGGR